MILAQQHDEVFFANANLDFGNEIGRAPSERIKQGG